jgi:hypothetical protein
MDEKAYRATPQAGPYVAGKRVPTVEQGGKTVPDPNWRLTLTEPQARYELLAGSIEEVPAPSAPEPAGDPPPPPGRRGKS